MSMTCKFETIILLQSSRLEKVNTSSSPRDGIRPESNIFILPNMVVASSTLLFCDCWVVKRLEANRANIEHE